MSAGVSGATSPVLLLIQMRLSKQTVELFPTATVNGTCHCKLQKGRRMLVMVSGIRLGFIASVIGGSSVRSRVSFISQLEMRRVTLRGSVRV